MEPRGLNAIPLPYEVDENRNHTVPAFSHRPSFFPDILRNLKQDDIILIVLIIMLLTEGNECDFLLVGVLVFIFLAGVDGNFLGF